MDDAHEHGEYQHSHGFLDRLKPDGAQGNVGTAEESGGHNAHQIAEKAAEHKTPESGGNAAVEKHLQGFSHAALHIFEF